MRKTRFLKVSTNRHTRLANKAECAVELKVKRLIVISMKTNNNGDNTSKLSQENEKRVLATSKS